MNLQRRLGKIEAALRSAAAEEIPALLNPTIEQEHAAIMSILETMPEEYQARVITELEFARDSPDWTGELTPLTYRVAELALLRIYQCPRPLALPAEFCRAFERLEEPGDSLRWDWWACMDCLLAHPTVVHVPKYYTESGRTFQRTYELFGDVCVACGGRISSRLPPTQAPCHDTVGSPYRLAMARVPPSRLEEI